MSDKLYYKVKPHNLFESEFIIVGSTVKEYGFCDTQDEAIKRFFLELQERVDSAEDELAYTRRKQQHFAEWVKNKDLKGG